MTRSHHIAAMPLVMESLPRRHPCALFYGDADARPGFGVGGGMHLHGFERDGWW